jgi:hypothetical protein
VNDSNGVAVAVALVVLAGFYFIPTVVALSRRVLNPGPAIIVNVLLGWSLVGWGVALYLACTAAAPTSQRVIPSSGSYGNAQGFGLAPGNVLPAATGVTEPRHDISHPSPWVFSCSCGSFSGATVEAAERHLRAVHQREQSTEKFVPRRHSMTYFPATLATTKRWSCNECDFTTILESRAREHESASAGGLASSASTNPQPPNIPLVSGARWEASPGPAASTEMKVCPDCAEEVRAAARKCRFCGYRFADSSASA